MTTVTTEVKFAIVPEWVLFGEVSDKAARLYGVLDRYANKDTKVGFPSRRTLADNLRCSVDTIDRALKELVAIGAVEVQARIGHEDGQRSNLYHLRVLPRGSRTDEAGGSITDAAGGSRTDAAHNESHNEREPVERENYIREFAQFWQLYPRKLDKGKARKAFTSACHRAPVEAILAGAAAYRNDPNRADEFTKYPATWLNADAWENEALPPRAGNGTREPPTAAAIIERDKAVREIDWREGIDDEDE